MTQYAKPDEDAFFEKHKVKPPERTVNLNQEDIQERLENFRSNHHCQWRQRGNRLYCDIGEYEHGVMIRTDKRLQGTSDNGLPILVNVV